MTAKDKEGHSKHSHHGFVNCKLGETAKLDTKRIIQGCNMLNKFLIMYTVHILQSPQTGN
jgi:hypothetical protein